VCIKGRVDSGWCGWLSTPDAQIVQLLDWVMSRTQLRKMRKMRDARKCINAKARGWVTCQKREKAWNTQLCQSTAHHWHHTMTMEDSTLLTPSLHSCMYTQLYDCYCVMFHWNCLARNSYPQYMFQILITDLQSLADHMCKVTWCKCVIATLCEITPNIFSYLILVNIC
jgi:hypothetical protein